MSELSIMKKGLCSSLQVTADILLTIAEGVAQVILKEINLIIDFLKILHFSPAPFIYEQIAKLTKGYNQFCPNLSGADDLINMINQCNFYNNTVFGSPTAALNAAKAALMGNAMSVISNIVSHLPEFTAAQMFETLLEQLSTKFMFDKQIDKIKKILGCIQAICGVDIESYLRRLNGLLTMLYMGSSGELDWRKFLEAGGIKDINKQRLMDDCRAAIKDANTAFDKSLLDIADVLDKTKWFDPFDPWPDFAVPG